MVVDKQEKGSSFLKMHDFFQTLKIREQHILKSLEKKKLSINFWPVDTKKKLYFFVGKNFFFSVAWAFGLTGHRKKKFFLHKKKIFFCWYQRSEIDPKLLSFPTIKDLYSHKIFGENFKFGDQKLTKFCRKKKRN